MLDFYEFRDSNELSDIRIDAIRNIGKLFNELKLDNVHEKFYVFCYLLWNGYFSVDKTYVYSNKDIKDEENTIFLGEGCCRHNARLLSMIFGKENFSLYFLVEVKKTNFQNMIPINRVIKCCDKKERPVRGYNHAITLVSDSSGVFFLDSTNLVEGEVLNASKFACVNGKYVVNRDLLQLDLGDKPYYKLSYNRRLSLNKKQLGLYYKEAQCFCFENQKLFDDFFDCNVENYQKIKRLVLGE